MFRVLLTGLLTVTLAGAARAETYYVATDGKPENDGSREKPWPSVEFALQKVGGGHTTVVRPGFYRGPLEVPRAYAGTENSPTVVRSEEKWKAIVVGSPGNGITVGDNCDWETSPRRRAAQVSVVREITDTLSPFAERKTTLFSRTMLGDNRSAIYRRKRPPITTPATTVR